jgi:hypothetical protein
MVELYLHFFIYLHGVMLNQLSTRITSHLSYTGLVHSSTYQFYSLSCIDLSSICHILSCTHLRLSFALFFLFSTHQADFATTYAKNAIPPYQDTVNCESVTKVGFQVFTAVTMKNAVFLDVALCEFIINRLSEERVAFIFRVGKISRARKSGRQ